MNILIASALNDSDRISRLWELLRYFSTTQHSLFLLGSGSGFAPFQDDYPDNSYSLQYPAASESDEDYGRLLWELNRPLQEPLEKFQPHVMLWDGEPFATHIANRVRVPIVSIDPEYMYLFARFSITIPPGPFDRFMALKKKLKQRQFRAHRHLLPTFVHANIRAQDVSLTQPIVRDDILQGEPSYGSEMLALIGPEMIPQLKEFRTAEQPVIAYLKLEKQREQRDHVLFERELAVSEEMLTESIINEEDIEAFEKAKAEEESAAEEAEFRVPPPQETTESKDKEKKDALNPITVHSERKIIRRRKGKLPEELNERELQSKLPPSEPGITYRVDDPDTWTLDLQTCKAVLCNGAASAIAEAIALKKPLLVVPPEGDFVAWSNAQHVEHMGFGEYHPKLTRAVLEGFLLRLDRYQSNLENYKPANPTFFAALEEQLPHFEQHQPPPSSQGRHQGGNRDRQGGNRQGGNRQGGNRQGGGRNRQDGGNRDRRDGNHDRRGGNDSRGRQSDGSRSRSSDGRPSQSGEGRPSRSSDGRPSRSSDGRPSRSNDNRSRGRNNSGRSGGSSGRSGGSSGRSGGPRRSGGNSGRGGNS